MKRFITFLAVALLGVLPARASLWNYYQEQGQKLPTVNQRQAVAQNCGIENYTGTAFENGILEKCLRNDKLGAVVPSSPALIDTYLSSGISAVDTSMTLANGNTRDGSALSGYMCFTLDVNTPVVEYVCGTATGASITGMLRGVNPTNPNVTSSVLAFAHRRLASVQVTDYPAIQVLTRKMNGVDTLDTYLRMTNPADIPTSSDQLVTKYYSDFVGAGGLTTLNVSSTQGLVYFNSTPGSVGINASSTTGMAFDAQGKLYQKIDTSAGLTNSVNGISISSTMLASAIATSTPTANKIPIANASGKLAGWGLYGGDGSDGVLNISSGTTTLNFDTSTKFLIKNYSSISITGTGVLNFSNSTTTGSVVILRSSGDCTFTSNRTPMLSVSGNGANGGAGVSATYSGTTVNTTGNPGSDGLVGFTKSNFGLGAATNIAANGGAIGTFVFYSNNHLILNRYPLVFVGAGGGSGVALSGFTGTANSGKGGNGGGVLIIECAGSWNFTTTNGISVAGQNASQGSGGDSNQEWGGSGGGGGGVFIGSASFVTSNSGTINVSGGSSSASLRGNGSATTRGGGGGGGSGISAGVNATADGGGNGAPGYSSFTTNTFWY